MAQRRFTSALITFLVLLPLLAFPVGVHGQGPSVYLHTVRAGQTLTGIASVYNVTITSIKEANKLTGDMIYVGQKLQITLAAPMVVHVVAKGENLYAICLKYNVSLRDVAWVNDISNTRLIYPDEKLVIPPAKGSVQPTPSQTPTVTPAHPIVQEAIIITKPVLNDKIKSPLVVTGWGAGFENTLSVAILSEEGRILGQGTAMVNAEFGQYGPFTGTITFTMPITAQIGKLQVYSVSARDGSIDHLNSVMIKLEP
jgi:LysM repeat protein